MSNAQARPMTPAPPPSTIAHPSQGVESAAWQSNSPESSPASRTCRAECRPLGGIFDFESKQARLEEVNLHLEEPEVWADPDQARSLSRERAVLSDLVKVVSSVDRGLDDAPDLLELARDEDDAAMLRAVQDDLEGWDAALSRLELRRMFSQEMDGANAFLDIQAGSGGTEAQDWAEMLLRMYLRWGERRGFGTEMIEASPGEIAGIKSATLLVTGDHAFGWLRTETGVHRLVRKSPFDSGHRRHTSFAAVYISPEVDDDIAVEINPADLRIDVYRASGAGGQHVNRTESAVRITHLPTGVVVQCQNDRSQHKNRATAMKQLKARLYDLELKKRREDQQVIEDAKSDIGWGNQIRSYVLDQSRIKDLRTGIEIGNTQAVLDGDLDRFIEASLKAGV